MGNSIGCSASGERLVSAARDGDLVEAKMLLDCHPSRAKYSTFGGLNSPLHFAAAKGHDEIVTLLLENGADVNSRNYCGQTALMQACRYGHWEVVQTLLLFRCNVTRADYLNGRTALHFATVNGHVRCIRLLAADLFPSAPFECPNSLAVSDKSDCPNNKTEYEANALSKLVNKAADGGLTALHMAALNGYFDCVHILLDLHANVSSTTFNYGSSMDMIGAGSTPLHYAACGGNLKCCQILLARGASRLSLNCNGWLPMDVARMWGHHEIEPLLKPNSDQLLPFFSPSNYLALPLLSVLNIARDCGLKLSATVPDDADTCAVCLERACSVAAEGCAHELCVRCALYLCSSSNSPLEPSMQPGSIPCPLCRHGITFFVKLPTSSSKDVSLPLPFRRCTPDMVKHSLDSVPSDFFGPVTCGLLSPIAIHMLPGNDAQYSNSRLEESGHQDEPPRRRSISCRQEKVGGMRSEKRWNVFWGKRRYSREHRSNAEINA